MTIEKQIVSSYEIAMINHIAKLLKIKAIDMTIEKQIVSSYEKN